jgi:modulator of FtsH protease
MNPQSVFTNTAVSAAEKNKVLRDTYKLLSFTLLFSALMAGVSMTIALPPMTSLIASIGALLLVWFVLPRTANSSTGIFVVFGFTGLLGLGLGPTLNAFLSMPGGSEVIMTAMGGTGVIFLGLSAYALMTKKDFSFLGGMMFAGMIVVLIAALANIFLQMPGLQLAISGAVILIMSGFILFDTSRIINGGETNYILATASLYLSIYNIFVSLLQILGAFNNED